MWDLFPRLFAGIVAGVFIVAFLYVASLSIFADLGIFACATAIVGSAIVGLDLCRSERNIHYQTLRVHTWGMAVLPHPPSCSTNPRGATATVYFYYLSSRRQPTLRPTSPISAPSCFSHFNLVRSSSGTPTYKFHLASGVGGVEVPSLTYHSSGAPNFKVQDRVVPTVF